MSTVNILMYSELEPEVQQIPKEDIIHITNNIREKGVFLLEVAHQLSSNIQKNHVIIFILLLYCSAALCWALADFSAS
jgi:hypothetical protein